MHATPVRSALAIAMAVVVVGCSAESGIAPATEESNPFGAPNPALVLSNYQPSATSAEFTVTRSGGYFQLGPHGVYFPSDVICDPATSTYGPEHWDEPCRTVREPITIYAEIRETEEGHPYVVFSPEVRFRPSKRHADWVWLYLWTERLDRQAAAGSLSILWVPFDGAEPIDEALSDPTLRTFYSPPLGVAFRRVKHFSGFQAADGRSLSTR